MTYDINVTESTVNVSSAPTINGYAYGTVDWTIDCIGNESNLTQCQLTGVQTEARCNAARLNCQGIVNTTRCFMYHIIRW